MGDPFGPVVTGIAVVFSLTLVVFVLEVLKLFDWNVL